MSIFASAHTTDVHPPSDPTATITIQKLSGRSEELAQAKHAEGAFDGFNGRGWSNRFIGRIMAGIADTTEVQAVTQDPLAGYDRLTLVRLGVKSWSYTVDGKPKPVTTAAIEDIDDDTLEFLAVEIMRLTRPSRFQTEDEREAARKNG